MDDEQHKRELRTCAQHMKAATESIRAAMLIAIQSGATGSTLQNMARAMTETQNATPWAWSADEEDE